jgi:hypothetical protein
MHLSLSQFALVTSLLATSVAFGKTKKETPKKQPQPKQQMVAAETPCRTHIKEGHDVFVTASFTYWQPTQENMKLGVVSNSEAPLDIVNGKEIDLNFKYKPGFKVGIGSNFCYGKWDTILQYTWFRGTEKVSKSLDLSNNNINLFPAWQIPNFLNPEYKYGSEKWKLRMDLIDWDLGRSFSAGTKLCLRPFVGLRGAIIDQKVDVSYVNTTASYLLIWPSTFVEQKSNSWGIGPRTGLTSNWKLGKGFRLYGTGEVDVLFTQYDLKSEQTSAVSFANRYLVKQNNANYLRTHLELDLGFGWGSYFASDKAHVDLSADYGFQVFFDQNMFRTFASAQAVGKSTLPNGNLYIQGLTATLRFDF